ncbi:MAG: DUF4249 family protein [Saprospiraceae bacterium]
MKVSKFIERFTLLIIFSIGLFGLSSCLDEIDFASAGTIDEAIAIQGKVVKANPSYISVTIRGVFNFTDVPRLLDARLVTVEDESGTTVELPTGADGIFYLEVPDNDPNFKIDYGKSYKINVSTFDNRNYSSSLEELLPAPVIEDLSATKTQIESVDINGNTKLSNQLTYGVSTPLKPENSSENARLLWEFTTTYQFTDSPEAYGARACRPTRIESESKTCYISSSPLSNYVSINGPELSVDRIDNFEALNTGISSIYSQGLYLTVSQQSLTQTAYDYWTQVGNVVARTGNLFQAPAGKVITNIANIDDPKDDVFGYFYATEESIRRVYVSPDLADNPPLPCPAPPSESGLAPNDCCNCSSVSNSSTVRPVWWIN